MSKLLILSVACLNGEISIKLWLSTCPAQTSSACATENNEIKFGDLYCFSLHSGKRNYLFFVLLISCVCLFLCINIVNVKSMKILHLFEKLKFEMFMLSCLCCFNERWSNMVSFTEF